MVLEVPFHSDIYILELYRPRSSSKIEFLFLRSIVTKMPLTKEEEEFVAQLSPKELALHKLAIEKLASSYFVWKSHAFNEWKEKDSKKK